MYRGNGHSRYVGFSVRCLRDETGGGTSYVQPTVTTSAATDVTSTSATLNGNVSNPANVAIIAQGFEWKATAGGAYVAVNATGETMTYNLTGLAASTGYTYRAFVTTAAGTSYGAEVSFSSIPAGDAQPCPGTPTVTDHEGNVYATVQIGEQCWTKTNLRVAPAGVTDGTSSGAYSETEPYYYVNPGVDAATYGYYYNWEAAKLVCPAGWHLPNDAEWNILEETVSGSDWQASYATSEGWRGSHAGKMAGDGWNSSSTAGAPGNATDANHNASGFSAVPAGDMYFGYSEDTGYNAYFWSSTEGGTSRAWIRMLNYATACVNRTFAGNGDVYSVRCLRDETGGGTSYVQPTVTTSAATDITSTSATLNGNVSNPANVAIIAQGFEWKATAGGAYVAVNATGETMTYNLTGLAASTGYTYRAFVTTAAGTSYGAEVSFSSIPAGDAQPCPGTPTVTDHEGNVYATVQIGEQCWMRDNLRTTTSPSTGTYLIPPAGTHSTYTGKQAFWYNNDSTTYAPMNYGLLYNWNAAVDTFNTAYGETSVYISSNYAVSVSFTGHRRGICPAGWHLPSDAEWTQLTDYVGGQNEYTCDGNTRYIAKALASAEGWNSFFGAECYPGFQSVTANNATGFSAVPAGSCDGSSFDSFDDAGNYASFWSSTEYSSYNAYFRTLKYDGARVTRVDGSEVVGYSVRCLRD